MYNNNLYVTLFFSFMWLAVVAGSVTSTQGVTLVPLGTTNYCTNGRMDEYVIASGIIPLVNDTLVFIAITWRLVRGSCLGSTRTGGSMWSFIFGKHLPAFSRSLLQDGQVYYLLSDFKNKTQSAIKSDIHFIIYNLQEHSWSHLHVSYLYHHRIHPCCLSLRYWDSKYHVDQRHGMSCIPKYQVRRIQRDN